MTELVYKWARTPDEAAALQADGWEPRSGCLATHHGHYSLLHRKKCTAEEAARIMGEAEVAPNYLSVRSAA